MELEYQIPLISCIFIIMINIVYFAKNRVNLIENKPYYFILIGSLLLSIIDTILHFISSYSDSVRILDFMPFIIVSNKIIVSLFSIIFSSIFAYIMLISYDKIRNNPKKLIFPLILANIISIIITWNLSYELIEARTARNAGGSVITFGYIIVAIYLILSLIIDLINYKKNDKRFLAIILILLSVVFMYALTIILPGIIIYDFILATICYIMYFTIENPDKKMIDALNEARLAAEKANHAKSDFLSSMSHEIRTPLNAIVGFSDCILEEETLDAAKNDAKDIKLASENLLDIVNGILDISKIEADKMEIVETDYNLVEVFENVAKLIKPRIGDKPIEFFVNFAPDLPYTVHGDASKVRQIVTNILTNAAKYTEEGKIEFDVNCVNEGDETKLVISVEDTGRGIKPEQIDKLFTKFQRLDEDKNTTLEGTGLGLAITKRFVEMIGGKIVVQSKYGTGSKFTVYLRQKIVTMNKPLDEKEEELINTMQIKMFDFSNCRVLVVDDNKVNIKVALKILSNYGIEADSCESGYAAIDKIKDGCIYDLILLDDMMPKMSGVETLKEIKKITDRKMTIVALTANALSGEKEKYLNEGFDDYLAKPIEKSELYRILLAYLNNKLKKDELAKKEKNSAVNLYTVKEDEDSGDLDTTRKSVLIVDDNKINIKVTSKLLSSFDLNIDSALSGKEAIEKVKQNNYDLVFMDIMMPEMDGVETLHHLRKDLNFKNPVVTLTADAVKGSKEKYLKEGFDDYIAKPINNVVIESVLKKYL